MSIPRSRAERSALRPRRSRQPSAFRRTLALYRDVPAAAQGHVKVRWLTCPFSAVASAIPRAGRILEIGCGHGVFSAYLALTAPDRQVTGVDIAPDKIAAARQAGRRARQRGAQLDFGLTAPGELPAGPWDAIAIVDVLYLLEPALQRELLEHAARLLAPGGVLAVKEMALQPEWKLGWCAFQELLAVRVLRITTGATLRFVAPAEMAGWLEGRGLRTERHPLHAGYLHPHHLVLARRDSSS